MDYFSSWYLGWPALMLCERRRNRRRWQHMGPQSFPPKNSLGAVSSSLRFSLPFFEENLPRCLNPPGIFVWPSRSDSAGFVAWPTPSELSKNEVVLGDGHGHCHGSSLENSLSSLYLGRQLAGWWCFFPLFWGLESPVFTGHHPS